MSFVAGARPVRLDRAAGARHQALRIAQPASGTPRRAGRRHKRGAEVASQPPAAVQEGGAAETRPNLAVFVSGGGSNFKAIHAAVLDGRIVANVAAVVTDKPGCGACKYAAQYGIPVLQFPTEGAESSGGDSPVALRDSLLHELDVDFVALAGYLKLVPREVVAAFPRAMLNIHPGLLPAFGGKGFYGSRVHRAVIASGARFTGPTVHFVDENYDTGPILAQRAIPVHPLEDHRQLAARVLAEARCFPLCRRHVHVLAGCRNKAPPGMQEHKLYPQTVAALVAGRITWRQDGIPILWEAK